MIGKFLENEENNSAVKTESNEPQPEETNSRDVFTLPQTQENDLSPVETAVENIDFNENAESSETTNLSEKEATDLSENKDYTVAPSDALVPVNVQTKTENPPPETTAETVRKTGLAWSAATVLGGSVVFMLVIGWFFDLVLGSKPWGVVGGIILGAIVGFIQFFRITSRIFNDESNTSTGILGDKD